MEKGIYPIASNNLDSPELDKGTYLLTDNNRENSLEVEIRMKMQVKGLYFIKLQKFTGECWHEQI